MVKMSASCSNMFKFHVYSIQRQKPDTKEPKLSEAQNQAAVSFGIRISQDKVALCWEGWGPERLLGAGNVVVFDLGGDYLGVQSVIISSALRICVADYTSQSKKFQKRKVMSFGEVRPGLESWFNHLAVVTSDKMPEASGNSHFFYL